MVLAWIDPRHTSRATGIAGVRRAKAEEGGLPRESDPPTPSQHTSLTHNSPPSCHSEGHQGHLVIHPPILPSILLPCPSIHHLSIRQRACPSDLPVIPVRGSGESSWV